MFAISPLAVVAGIALYAVGSSIYGYVKSKRGRAKASA